MTVQRASSSSSPPVSPPGQYRRKYQLLLERCEVLQQDNQRVLTRAARCARLARRVRAHCRLLGAALARPARVQSRPAAPKRPCNAFFQFCRRRRPGLAAGRGAPGEPEPARRLAQEWRALSAEDRRQYVDMFQRSKERYAEQMSAYVNKEH